MKHETLTFAGLPPCRDLAQPAADIALIGVNHGSPYERGTPSHSAGAPDVIRRESLRYPEDVEAWDFDLGGTLLGDSDARVVDCGDVPGSADDAAGNRRRAEAAVHAILEAGAVPIVIGGDDSVPIPVFQAFAGRGPLHILQIDAHIDWRDEVQGVRQGYSSTMRRASEMPWVAGIIQVGMRAVGSARRQEVEAAAAYGAHLITARQVAEEGWAPVLDLLPHGASCYITLDCDGLDPAIMPAVAAPAPGGLSYRQVIDLIHSLAKRTRIAGFNLVEFAPERDVNELGAVTAVRLLWNVIGVLARATYVGGLQK